MLHFKLKLIQYEFWEYENVKLTELKNIYKTEIKENVIEYKLKDNEISNIEEKLNIGEFSVVVIEKESTEKFISIPFEFKKKKKKKKYVFYGDRTRFIRCKSSYSKRNILFRGRNAF